jgi:hypothetical protein
MPESTAATICGAGVRHVDDGENVVGEIGEVDQAYA